MKKYIYALTFLIAAPSFAYDGKITFLHGKVTVLKAHHLKAEEAKIQDELSYDSSIVTYEKSIAKITMNDGSVLTVGPNSMLHVQQFINKETEKPGIVSLLRGQLGAVINEQTKIKGYKSKIILKTRTAAMGVRGTEFSLTFNEQSQGTTLVTYQGTVVMAKNDPSVTNDIDKIGQAFNEQGVQVSAGEFSTATLKENKVSAPDKVNTDQIAYLAQMTLAKDESSIASMLETEKKITFNSDNGKIIDLEKAKVADAPVKTIVAPEQPIVADVPTPIKKWYAGAQIGIAKSSTDSEDVAQELKSRGIAGTGSVRHQTRLVGKSYVGYQFNENISSEAGFVFLGKASTSYANVSAADLQKLTDLQSKSANGPELSGRYKVALNEDLSLAGKLGLVYFSNYHVTEATYGYGLEAKNERLGNLKIRLDYDHYHMKGNSTHLLTAGVSLPF